MDPDLEILATALYVTTDDLLTAFPELAPHRPVVGFVSRITDAELILLAVMQAHLGFTSENRWIRYAGTHLREQFASLAGPARIQQAPAQTHRDHDLADHALRPATQIVDDDVWVIHSTPVECARSRETVKRSALAGSAQCGNCASHSRFCWGFRLHLDCTLHGLPVGWALTGAKADERETLLAILSDNPAPDTGHRQLAIADKNYFGHQFEVSLNASGIDLLRPALKGETERAGLGSSNRCDRSIESINAP